MGIKLMKLTTELQRKPRIGGILAASGPIQWGTMLR